MITIELTPEEARFIFENLAQLQVPLSNANAPEIALLGVSVLNKLKAGLNAANADKAKPPLASAAGRPRFKQDDEPEPEAVDETAEAINKDEPLDLGELADAAAG